MSDSGLSAWIVTAGGGTLIGTVVISIFQAFGKRGHARAEAADLATSAAARVIERLEKENIQMRHSLVAIIEVLDAVIDDLPIDHPSKDKLKNVIATARLSTI